MMCVKIKYSVCVCVCVASITYNPSSQKFNQRLPFTHFSITQTDLLGHLNVQDCTLHGPFSRQKNLLFSGDFTKRLMY